MNKAGVKFGIILIMTAMCLAGCSKEKAFVDSCDSEIAEQVTSIMQESQKGRYNLENCEVFVTEESKKDGYVVRRMTFQADWKRVREPIDDPLIRGMLQARDELESPGKKEKRCFHSGNMWKKTGLKMPKSGCRRDADV